MAGKDKPTLDQRRANHAWKAIQAAKSTAGKKKYGGQAKKLPIRITTSGLGQALAFIHAKKHAPELLRDIADWVLARLDKRADDQNRKEKPAEDALIKEIIAGDSNFLRRATDETLAYLQWLNRFAEAEGLTDD